MKKKFCFCSAFLFLILFYAPLAGQLLLRHDTSYIPTIEKRIPHIFPEMPTALSGLPEYINKLDLYLSDHYGFRQHLLRLYNRLMFTLNISGSQQVLLGGNGWLFLNKNEVVNQYRGSSSFSPDELREWIQIMHTRKKWLAGLGIDFLVVIVPDKHSIYSEHLPSWATKVGKTSLELLHDTLEKKPLFSFLDLTPTLTNAKKQGPLYYQTDSHWNLFGAYYGYLAVINKLKPDHNTINKILPKDVDFTFLESPSKSLGKQLCVPQFFTEHNDVQTAFTKKTVLLDWAPRIVQTRDVQNARIPSVATTSLIEAPRVLVIRDSFGNQMAPYLNQSFKEVLYCYNGFGFNKQSIERSKPDIVIFMVVERLLKQRVLTAAQQ